MSKSWNAKLNLLLFACISIILEDVILFDTPTVCVFRFEMSVMQAKEEAMHEREPTPSNRAVSMVFSKYLEVV